MTEDLGFTITVAVISLEKWVLKRSWLPSPHLSYIPKLHCLTRNSSFWCQVRQKPSGRLDRNKCMRCTVEKGKESRLRKNETNWETIVPFGWNFLIDEDDCRAHGSCVPHVLFWSCAKIARAFDLANLSSYLKVPIKIESQGRRASHIRAIRYPAWRKKKKTTKNIVFFFFLVLFNNATSLWQYFAACCFERPVLSRALFSCAFL